MCFMKENFCFDSNFPGLSKGRNRQQERIDLGNGLAQNRLKAINWTNADML